jgi:hypothetical protein
LIHSTQGKHWRLPPFGPVLGSVVHRFPESYRQDFPMMTLGLLIRSLIVAPFRSSAVNFKFAESGTHQQSVSGGFKFYVQGNGQGQMVQ